MPSHDHPTDYPPPASVLVVDGDMLNAMATEAMLKDMGVETVRTTRSIPVAIAILESIYVDLVIVDLDTTYPASPMVTERLLATGVTAIFSSDRTKDSSKPPRAIRFLQKPYSEVDLGCLLH